MDLEFHIVYLFLSIVNFANGDYLSTPNFKVTGRTKIIGTHEVILGSSFDCDQDGLFIRTPSHISMFTRGNLTWRRMLPGKLAEETSKHYPIGVVDGGRFGNFLFARAESGLRFYKMDANQIPQPLFEDGKFADVFGWKESTAVLALGKIFPTRSSLGLVTRNKDGVIKFYSASYQSLANRDKFAVRELSPPLPLLIDDWWSMESTQIFIVDLEGQGKQEFIVAWGKGNFSIKKFDRSYNLETIVSNDLYSNENFPKGRLMFGNITGSKLKDILMFQTTGLYLAKWNDQSDSFEVEAYYTDLSEKNGWHEMEVFSVNLVDLDGDGRDELIYSGRSGFGVVSFYLGPNNEWIIKPAVSTNLSLKDKYSSLKAVVQCPGKKAKILLETEKADDYEFDMVEVALEEKPRKTCLVTEENHSETSLTLLNIPERDAIIEQKWLDWYDVVPDSRAFINEKIVNPETGQVALSLPLFFYKGINLRLSYDSSRHQSSPVGVGWSIPLTKNFVFLDTSSSIFEELHSYYLSLDGFLFTLNRTDFSSTTQKKFSVSSYNITATYHLTNKTWVINQGDELLIFGGNSAAIQQSLVWPWGYSGKQSESHQLEEQAGAWYLSSRHIRGQKVTYKYMTEMERVGHGKSYTTQIYLEEIVDKSNSISINFGYTQKETDWYTNSTPTNPDGSLSFPIPLTQGMSLSSIEASTPASKQRFNFVYASSPAGMERLKRIDQFLPVLKQTQLFLFENNEFGYLSKVSMPTTDVHLKIEYSRDPSKLSETATFPLGEMGDLVRGPGYFILHQLNRIPQKQVKLAIYQNDINTQSLPVAELVTNKISLDLTGYVVLPFPSHIFVILTFLDGSKRVDYFSMDASSASWIGKPTDFFLAKKEDKVIPLALSLINIVPNKSEVTLLQAGKEGSNRMLVETLPLPLSLGANITLSTQQNYVAFYDNNNSLFIIHKGGGRWAVTWRQPEISMFTQITKNFLDKFDVNQELVQGYKDQLISAMIKTQDNTLVLSAPTVQMGYTNLNLLVMEISKDYAIKQSQSFNLFGESLGSLNYTLENKENSSFILKYKYYNSTYGLEVSDVKGKIREDLDTIRNINRRADALWKLLEDVNDNKEWKALLKNMTMRIFDWKKLSFYPSPNGICVGDNKIIPKGSNGGIDTLPTSRKLRLGPHLILWQKEESGMNYEIVQTNNLETLHSMKISPAWNVMVAYPFFLAYQSNNNVVVVPITPDGKGIGNEIIFGGEALHSLTSSSVGLVTSRNASSVFLHHASAREIVLIKPQYFQQPQVFKVSKIERLGKAIAEGKVSRIISYEYDRKEKNTRVIPGGKRNDGGWIDINFGEGVAKSSFYNAKGSLIKVESVKETDQVGQGNRISDEFILRNKRHVQIFSSYPYQMKDGMVSYIGFEETEGEHSNNLWIYDKSRVTRTEQSLTGKAYLKLDSTLEKHFKPADQYGIFVASAWVRIPSVQLRVGDDVPFFKVIYFQSSATGESEIIGLLGKVQDVRGDWAYIEVTVNLPYAREEIYAAFLNTGMFDNSIPISFKIIISHHEQNEVHVDHVSFYPEGFSFQANVYCELGLAPILTDIIGSGGKIRSLVYSWNGRQVGESHNGVVLEMRNAEKPAPNPVSLVFESKQGFYEKWENASFQTKWEVNQQTRGSLSVSQAVLKGSGKVKLRKMKSSSFALRMDYILLSQSSLAIHFWSSSINVWRNGDSLHTSFQGQSVNLGVRKTDGELILLCSEGRVVMWIDSQIIWDKLIPSSENPLSLEILNAEIHSFLFLQDPKLKITYFNGLQEPVQELLLESPNSVIISQHLLNDELGRPFLKTKETRMTALKDTEPLLKYYSGFVTSYNENTGILNGDVLTINQEDEGFPYFLEEYEDYPGGQVLSRGLPGKNYAIGKTFGYKTKVNNTVPFLTNMFPRSEGFSFKSRMFANGKETFWIYKDGIIRATYIKAPSFDHRLTTYDYNEKKQLVAVLPPEYHETAHTFSQIVAWKLSIGQLERNFGTFYVYDDKGKLQSKSNREEGTINFLYDSFGNIRFRVYQDYESLAFVKTIFTYYNPSGLLWMSGLYTQTIRNLAELEPYLGEELLPLRYSKTFQDITYSASNLKEMDKVKKIITYNEAGPVIDKLVNDKTGEVVEKSLLMAPTLLGDTVDLTLTTEWVNQVTKKVCYPGSALCLLYNYNKIGHIVSIISTGCESEAEAQVNLQFEYNARGQVVKEETNGNVRIIKYNSPGFITMMEDKFASLALSYESKGYSAYAPGIGIVSKVKWRPKWKNNLKRQNFKLKENSPPYTIPSDVWRICLKALRRTGYIDKHNIPTGKPLRLSLDNSIPLLCGGKTGYTISDILSRNAPPEINGYKIDYGSHGEVLRAKYWMPDQGESDEPLQPHSFSQISEISQQMSLEIFKKLVDAEIIISNGPKTDIHSHIGYLSNIDILRENDLRAELKKLDSVASQFSSALIKTLANYYLTHKQSISYTEFEKRILEWSGFFDTPTSGYVENERKLLSRRIYEMIQAKNFDENFFALNFLSKLPPQLSHSKKLEVGKVLLAHQQNTLGTHPFDFDVLQADHNGNQKNFFKGHKIYSVKYRSGSANQISNVTVPFGNHSKTHTVKYDSDGNVIEAPYKGITLSYDPITKRPTTIKLDEGGLIKFAYDGQGERVLKQVYSISGYLEKETSYLRDERARVVMEKEVVREEATDSESSYTLTYFVYGPRGLVGFVRDGSFYAVMTDHLGSVRMVTKDNEVIAAYDYLPYGDLQKSYLSDPKGGLNFRFGGKELDEETGLYNFHARLYDPSLGRFFQTDPMWQYSSPYLYAGNSPFSLVDPDGEVAITLIVIGAAVGAYFGGAAVNNRWNPLDWDYSDPGTYIGIVGGGIVGGFLPAGFVASVEVIGVTGTVALGAGVAYLSTAASNNKWNPAEWEWDRPHTYNAIFQGFAIGSSIPAGVKSVGEMVNNVASGSQIAARILHSANFVAGAGVAYGLGVTAHGGEFNPLEWDWTSPATYSSLSTGFYSGYALPTLIAGSVKGIGNLISSSKNIKWNSAMIKNALKNPKSPIYKTAATAAGAYMVGAMANEDFDITSWNFKSLTTYQGILNGAFMGKGLYLYAVEKLTPKPILNVKLDYTKLRTMSVENPAQFNRLVKLGLLELKGLKSMFNVKIHVINKPKLLTQSARSPRITPLDSSRSSIASLDGLERQFSQASRSSLTIRADRKLPEIPCIGSRFRRALPLSCILKPDSRSQVMYKNIRWSPSLGLAMHPITTQRLDVHPRLQNNAVVDFTLAPLARSPDHRDLAFALVANPDRLSSNDHIRAYYLDTEYTITIPASPFTDRKFGEFQPLVITNEMSGCSLYVRHDQVSDTLTIFHHRRYFKNDAVGGRTITKDSETGEFIVRNPKTGIDEIYDDVLAYEEYNPDVLDNNNERVIGVSTVFLFYEQQGSNAGQWQFGNQMMKYTPGQTYFDFSHRGFEARPIYGIPDSNGRILTRLAPPPPGA